MSEDLVVWDKLDASPDELFIMAYRRRADLRRRLDPYVSKLESICVSAQSGT